ncbi:MAG TPA: hypothetical protein VK892_18660 [Pyrinomonadaceae bacterium]|nr:hypothetical protein [Pyrinomonadaceae bacterium]
MPNTGFNTGVIKPIECVKEAWEGIKDEYWLLFAIGLVGALIGGVSLYVLLGAMACGIYYAYLKKIDGKTVSLDDLWKGFSYFMPSLLVTAVIVIPMIIVYGMIYVPVIIAAVMGPKLSSEEFMALFFGALAIDLVFIVIMVCFHTLLMFSFPLIVDRNLSGMQAMKTSARAVWKNLGGVGGLIVVNLVLTFLGALACGIGIYFVIPILIAANAVAYRKVFPAPGNQNLHPPPPYAFQGAGDYN